ncbi:MAG: hypothetical protein EOO90_18805 [Pedobacter sp.]|nr:MAG: hypothetical protein EOO90_18805 [Pedobacter sp.]
MMNTVKMIEAKEVLSENKPKLSVYYSGKHTTKELPLNDAVKMNSNKNNEIKYRYPTNGLYGLL